MLSSHNLIKINFLNSASKELDDKRTCSTLQLSSEASRLLGDALSNVSVAVNFEPVNGPAIRQIADYIEEMCIQLWDTAFYREFKEPKGVQKNFSPKRQFGLSKAVRRTVYRYIKNILIPTRALALRPPILAGYLDKDNQNCIMSKGIEAMWGQAH